MELISTLDAAERKGVTRAAIAAAVERGAIDGQKLGARSIVVKVNRKFEEWQPMKVRQEAGRKAHQR